MAGYQEYLSVWKDRKKSVVLVEDGRGWQTFGESAVAVAAQLGRPLVRIGAHRTVYLRPDEVTLLEEAGLDVVRPPVGG